MALESIIETAVLFVFLQKALAGLKRINLEGLRWRVFDAKGQVGSLFFFCYVVLRQCKVIMLQSFPIYNSQLVWVMG